MTRKSSGETYAQIAAEKDNPKGDVWWGGTGDPHLQAAEEGLTEAYTSPLQGELQDWAVKQHEAADGRTVGIYAGALGFGYNKELLAQKGLPEPKCWADLIKPEFKGEIQMANPNSSGTAYTALATFVQMMGEDKAFDYLKQLHANINQYTKSGSAPIKAAAQGETTVGIVFQHDAVTMAVSGAPIEVVSPCEGTGYEIGSMSIIKGARNPEMAQEILRLRAARRHPEPGQGRQGLSGAVEQGRDAAARSARLRLDQADRLRLRQVRLGRRAHAAAEEVGGRGQLAAALMW